MSRTLLALIGASLLIPTAAHAERDYSGQRNDGRPPPLSLEAGPLTVFLNGRAQVQGAFLVGEDARLDNGDAAFENPGVRLRRARMGLSARMHRMRLGVEIDLLESEGTSLHEAYIGYDSKWALAYAGLVKVPMSRSALFSSEASQMAERSLGVKHIAPFQQLGLMVGGKVWQDRIRLLLGVFNGMNRGQTFNSGWARINPKNGNQFGGYALAARLDVEPLGLLGAGPSDLGQRRAVDFGIGGGFLLNQGETVKAMGFSGDLLLKAYGFSLLYEYLQMKTEPAEEPSQATSTTAKVTRSAHLAQLGYTIVPLTSGIGAIEVAVRGEMVDDNADRDDEGDFMAIAGTVSWYLLNGHVKTQIWYQHRLEMEGIELDNDVLMLNVEGRF
jgi:hypothetical protein